MRTYKPHARVARRRFRRIDEVDGVLITHTQPEHQTDRKVTATHPASAPLPFTAKTTPPATVAVPAMCAVVLTAITTALVAVLDGHHDTTLAVLAVYGVLIVWTLLMTVPALVRGRR